MCVYNPRCRRPRGDMRLARMQREAVIKIQRFDSTKLVPARRVAARRRPRWRDV
jgi:hypothetical protein